jgi:hypothetical protein
MDSFSLVHLRDQLQANYLKYIDFLLVREVLVHRLQKLKPALECRYNLFDPARELEIFQFIHQSYPQLSLYQLHQISTLVEFQVRSFNEEAYPHWTEMKHCADDIPFQLSHQINPLLLTTFGHKTKLNAEFSKLLQGYL